MKPSKLRLLLASTATALIQLLAPAASRADTYQIVGLDTDAGVYFYGMDAAGGVVLFTGQSYCGGQYQYCYGRSGNWSGIAPTLIADDGTGCTPSLPPGTSDIASVCNNGRAAYYGYPFDPYSDAPGLYTFRGANPRQFIYGGFLTGPLYMNKVGDIVFDDGGLDDWLEAIDLTTSPPPTPEPSTLLLLATGIGTLGLGVLLRRSPLLSGTPSL